MHGLPQLATPRSRGFRDNGTTGCSREPQCVVSRRRGFGVCVFVGCFFGVGRVPGCALDGHVCEFKRF